MERSPARPNDDDDHDLNPAMPAIEHRPAERRFRLDIDGHTCVADYRIVDDELWITHTGVPHALRGRGLAGRLVQAAIDHAQSQGLRVVPVCSYAAAYLRRAGSAAAG